jgi:hypothetical protein
MSDDAELCSIGAWCGQLEGHTGDCDTTILEWRARAETAETAEAERDRLREALRALLVFNAASADALAEAAPDYRAAVLRARALVPDTLEENIAKYGPLVPECDGASATATCPACGQTVDPEHAAAPPSGEPASEPPNATGAP